MIKAKESAMAEYKCPNVEAKRLHLLKEKHPVNPNRFS
jgi:hypothetical protein